MSEMCGCGSPVLVGNKSVPAFASGAVAIVAISNLVIFIRNKNGI
jgi:hypothetical protein